MFSEPGPSRYQPPPGDGKYPPRDGPPGQRGPPRRDGPYERDDRSNGFGRSENGPRPYPNTNWRPPPRFGNGQQARARTPSPPRGGGDFDRAWSRPRDGPDPRDRPPPGPRPGGGPDWRGPGREPWSDRRPPPGGRDERYDNRGPPGGRVSPTRGPGFYPDRQHSPPRGPKERGPPQQNGPYPTGPRVPSGPYNDRDRDRFDRIGFPGRDGERSREPSSQSAPGARGSSPPRERPPVAPRSMRGSSSPVEVKHHRPVDAPLSTPTSTIPLPSMAELEREDGELEEGEVLSPVRSHAPVMQSIDSFRPRSNFSPPKRDRPDRPMWNDRRGSPVKRERSESPKPWKNRESVDDGWAGRARRSSAQSNSHSPDKERPNPIQTSPPSVPSSNRPPTPPLPSAGSVQSPVEVKGEVAPDPSSPDVQHDLGGEDDHSKDPQVTDEILPAETLPLPPIAEESPLAPHTSDVEAQQEDVRADEKESISAIMDAAQEVASAVNVTLPEVVPETAVLSPPAEEPQAQPAPLGPLDASEAPPSTLPLTVAAISSPPKSATIEVPPPVEVPPPTLAPPVESFSSDKPPPRSTRVLRNPSPLPRQTLAERRAVVLPPTNGPLSSPFVAKSAKDAALTGVSMAGSTDSEYTPAIDHRDDRSDISMSEREETKSRSLIHSIKHAQLGNAKFNPDNVLQVNIATSPTESSRVKVEMDNKLRNRQLRDTTWPLHKTSGETAKRLARLLAKQGEDDVERVERLKEEYRELEVEWKEHCELLDEQMAKRGPPPADLYAVPSLLLPVITPGPAVVPTTPVAEDLSARNIRGRGRLETGFVNSEADFEAVLAMFADDEAKDPNVRASKTTATVPDMMLPWERTMRYDDENDVVIDPLSFYDYSGTKEPIWTEEERAIFLRRYLNFPKLFGKIAEHLPDKTASDCVLYYYRTKKEVDYKAMLASRRGVTKKKPALPIKKGGKSSALLSDLARSKPTVVKPLKPSSSARSLNDGTTIARKAKEVGVKKRNAAEADEAAGDEAFGPRAEAGPSSGLGKAKMRVSVKTKRPRISSLPDIPGPSGSSSASVLTAAQAQNELLPPLKRPKKQRKVELADANSIPADGTPGGTPGDKAPRRGNTSSYWSVDEKKRVKELFNIHGRNVQAIAAEMPGKTERQISNYVDGHILASADGAGAGAGQDGGAGADVHARANGLATMAYDRMYPQLPGTAPTYPAEPRLGVFPTTPSLPAHGERGPIPADSPIKHVSRPGGMRISALLNDDAADDPPPAPKDAGANDAASDGTVDEQDGTGRTSPRTAPMTMSTIYDANRRYSGAGDRPMMGGYRAPEGRSGAGGYGGFWASRPPTYPQAPPPHAYPHHQHQHQHPHQRSVTGPASSSSTAWDRTEPPPPNVHHNVGQPSMGYFRPDYRDRERLAPPGMHQQQHQQQTSSERYSPSPAGPGSHARAESAPERGPPRENSHTSANSLPPLRNTPSPHPSAPGPTASGAGDAGAGAEKPSNQPWKL